MLIATVAAITGGWTLTKKSAAEIMDKSVKVFVRAAALKNYPGQIKPLFNIDKNSKWSG